MALYYSNGTISYMSEVQSGTTNNGNTWQRMTLHLEIPGFQGSIFKQVFQVSGKAVDDVLAFKVGDKVNVSFSLYAREWNGKWYNNVDLVKIQAGQAKQAEQPQAESAPAQAEQPQVVGEQVAENDLPW